MSLMDAILVFSQITKLINQMHQTASIEAEMKQDEAPPKSWSPGASEMHACMLDVTLVAS